MVEPSEVQEGVRAAMAAQAKERHGFYMALEQVMDLAGLPKVAAAEEDRQAWVEQHFTWQRFQLSGGDGEGGCGGGSGQ